MEITKKELLMLLGAIEDIGSRLEFAGITKKELERLVEMDSDISWGYDFDSSARWEAENELFLKLARRALNEGA